MRPLELKLRNFRSYAGEHSFDFRDRSLIGVVGPIGSGKSSVLDGIAFALYGRTPRIGAATKSLINQRAADMTVSLRFQVESEIWEAVRSIRMKGQSNHALYRYQDDDPDAEPAEKLTMEGEVNEKIVELLGLEFSAFERSVLLAQGRFAEFLQSRPADRDKVLKGVFGHDRVDRMKSIAKARKDSAELALEKLAVRLENVDQTRKALEAAAEELTSAEQRQALFDKAVPAIRKLDKKESEAAAAIEKATDRLQGLQEHTGQLPDQETSRRALADAAAAEKSRLELGQALDKAQQELQRTDVALKEATASGEADVITRGARLLAAADPQLKAVVDADRRIASAKERVAAAKGDIANAKNRLVEAEGVKDKSLGRAVEAAKILEEAEHALQVAQHANMAATLRHTLEADAPCPVCEQLVEDLPEAAGDSHLTELEAVVESARLTNQDVEKTRTSALTSLERIREQLEGTAEKLAAAESQLSAAEEDAVRARGDLEETTMQLEKLLGPGDPGDHLEERRKALEVVVSEREEAQRRVDQIRGLHDQAIRDEQEAGKATQDLGVRLAALAARLEFDIEVGDDPAGLSHALTVVRQRWAEATQELAAARKAAQEAQEAAQSSKRKELQRLGVEGTLDEARAVLGDRIGRLGSSIEGYRTEIDGASELFAQRGTIEDDVEVFTRINADLTDARFVRFLLDDERRRLAELGSEHFQQLSAGRYRFSDDQFAIVDLTAADVVRKSDSLSGGETFLASLGLALALAEMVAGTGGRLDAFFLDEGFGTLDPEHLDLAMDGIERLVAGDADRLVVVVSHVPEMRMRLEDLIELERNPVSGDTRVVSS